MSKWPELLRGVEKIKYEDSARLNHLLGPQFVALGVAALEGGILSRILFVRTKTILRAETFFASLLRDAQHATLGS